MTPTELASLNITLDDYLRSLAFNAVRAAMDAQNRALMTSADAKRADLIFQLLHLDNHDPAPHSEAQVLAEPQPEVHSALADIEERLQAAMSEHS